MEPNYNWTWISSLSNSRNFNVRHHVQLLFKQFDFLAVWQSGSEVRALAINVVSCRHYSFPVLDAEDSKSFRPPKYHNFHSCGCHPSGHSHATNNQHAKLDSEV